MNSTTKNPSTLISVALVAAADKDAWDSYVHNHPQGTLYHLYGWKNVIEKTYGDRAYYLMAYKDSSGGATNNSRKATDTAHRAVGILPLIHLKHFLFGNSLVSIPFFDTGGILANDKETEKTLLLEAIKLGQELKAKSIELRHAQPLSCLSGLNPMNPLSLSPQAQRSSSPEGAILSPNAAAGVVTKSHKVCMLLELPDSSEALMKSFKAKLRSQIKKPIKEGLIAKIGGIELLDDFYRVFSENMRDLGSPVHSKDLIQAVLEVFPSDAGIIIVYKENKATAGGVIVGFKEVFENPWASALRKYNRLSANMLLYWTMLEYACDRGYKYFDFGRSTPDERTYKFKEQWGAKPTTLNWHYISLNGSAEASSLEKSHFTNMIEYWKKLPVPVTKILGPMIRKHIPL